MVPAHDLCLLLRAGDIESNPGPTRCSVCEVTLRSGQPYHACEDEGCSEKCHKKQDCSGLSRYGSTAWRCNSHGGSNHPQIFNVRPTSATGVCYACIGPIRNHQRSLFCSEAGCMARSHLERACSGLSRYASEDWSCPIHNVVSLPPRERSPVEPSLPSPSHRRVNPATSERARCARRPLPGTLRESIVPTATAPSTRFVWLDKISLVTKWNS